MQFAGYGAVDGDGDGDPCPLSANGTVVYLGTTQVLQCCALGIWLSPVAGFISQVCTRTETLSTRALTPLHARPTHYSALTKHHPPPPVHRNSTRILSVYNMNVWIRAFCKLQRQQRQRRPPKTKEKKKRRPRRRRLGDLWIREPAPPEVPTSE